MEKPARFDFHVHSQYSPDGRGTLEDLARAARARGLSGFAVTDHNNLRMAQDIAHFKDPGLLIVPGMEVSTAVGHCLALGVQRDVHKNLGLAETLDAIRDAGGVGVPSHPFRLVHGAKARNLDAAGKALVAIEMFNARDGNPLNHRRASDYAKAHGLGGTGGSDAHQVFEVGNAYTVFPERPGSVDDVVSLLRRRATWGEGRRTPRRSLLRQNVKNALLFARRGFRSI